MGQECTTCKTCTDQEEILAKQSIEAIHIVTKTLNDTIKDKINISNKRNKTSQKSTNFTVNTFRTNNYNIKTPIQKKNKIQKYKRKEGRKTTEKL